MTEKPPIESEGWNLLYVNTNPNPDTICDDCRQFIGQIFPPGEQPPLPMHPHCYCLYKPIHEPPTWPHTSEHWGSWEEYFAYLQDNDPAAYRRWVQRAAWYLRIGWPLGIMLPLADAAERYNDDEYEPPTDDDDDDDGRKPQPPKLPIPKPPSPPLLNPSRRSGLAREPKPCPTPSSPLPDSRSDLLSDSSRSDLLSDSSRSGLLSDSRSGLLPDTKENPMSQLDPNPTATHDPQNSLSPPTPYRYPHSDENPPETPPDGQLHGLTSDRTGHVTLEGMYPSLRTYEVTLVCSGRIQQDDGEPSHWLIPAHVLEEAAINGLFDALPHYVDHPDLFGFGWHQRPSVRDLAGIVSSTYYDTITESIIGKLTLYDTPAGQLLGTLYDHILADAEAGKDVPPLGLSIVCFRDYRLDESTGLNVWTHIKKVSSVDAVYEPGAAGYIRQALSNAPPDNLFPTPTAERRLSSAAYRNQAPDAESHPHTPDPYAETTVTYPTGGTMPEDTITQNPEDVSRSDLLSDNPAPAADSLDPVAINDNLTALNNAVDRLHNILAQQEEPNTIHGLGDPPRSPTLYGGLTGIDQVQLAVEALISGTRPAQGVRPLSGIRELYMLLSGDYELTGQFQEDRIYLANVTTSTMAGIVANALNKVVVNMFQQYDQWWAPGTSIRDFNSLQDVRWITLGGVGELPTVAEGAAYTEMTWDDQTETDSFVKKGGYLGLTIETIDKDDTGRVMAAPRALAQAAWLTLGKAIAAVFTANSGYGQTMSDSNYLFDNTNHANQGSTALSFAAWQATQILMMKYTELNSAERLGALTRPRFLWVPIDLENTAVEILAAGEGEPDDADYHVNPDALADGLTARTAAARRRVITVPFWTDTNDWVAQADPQMYPGLGLAFRYGRTPEIFSVADPRAGLMFTNDTMPIKVRFFFAVGPTDWRAWYKHIV